MGDREARESLSPRQMGAEKALMEMVTSCGVGRKRNSRTYTS